MSGPKVVRIVTREEIIALCQGHLARVEAALSEWIRVGRRNDCVTEAEVEGSKGRLEQLRALLQADRFMDLQKQAPIEATFLQNDMEGRLARAASEASSARAVARRQSGAAETLLKALKQRERDIPPGLEERLKGSGEALQKAMAEGFALLGEQGVEARDGLKALAQSLKEAEGSRSLTDWVAAQPADPALARLDKRLAELAVLSDPQTVAVYEGRLSAVAGSDDGRRDLLLDSLEMDLSRTLADAKRRARQSSELEQHLAELAVLDARAAEGLRKGAEASDANLERQIELAKAAVVSCRESIAAVARRSAVLQGLAGLGYEVTEGLSTAWSENGRVVLRKAAQPAYGVEISGDPGAAKMQMRVVAFEGVAPASTQNDRDAETQWCGDVSTLEAQLAAAGGGLVIERALAVGATPVKRMEAPAVALDRTAREGPTGQTRSLS